MTKTTWLFLNSGPNTGEYNMNMDNAILDSFDPDSSLPVFRIYGWSPPAISLGRFQDPKKTLNISKCMEKNIPIVSRITGGGAIFHDDEITYSLVCHPEETGYGSVKDSYRKICGFIINMYKELGLDAEFACSSPQYTAAPAVKTDFCFSGWEEYDILIGGKKIGGNAQKRKKNVIFQHGSIPLSLDIEYIQSFFLSELSEKGTSALSLCDLIKDITSSHIIGLLKKSFISTMNADLTEDTSILHSILSETLHT
ncbi:MAG: lipoate--protein ligase family protein [Elusimicrobiota bacterium]